MKRLHWKVLAGLVVGCVFLAQGAGAESETPSLSAQIDELFADRSHSDAPGAGRSSHPGRPHCL